LFRKGAQVVTGERQSFDKKMVSQVPTGAWRIELEGMLRAVHGWRGGFLNRTQFSDRPAQAEDGGPGYAERSGLVGTSYNDIL
jgi:hypothetical protein